VKGRRKSYTQKKTKMTNGFTERWAWETPSVHGKRDKRLVKDKEPRETTKKSLMMKTAWEFVGRKTKIREKV